MLWLGLRFAEAWLDLTGWSGPLEQCSVQRQLRSFNAENTISRVWKLSLCVNFSLVCYCWIHILSLVDIRYALWWFRMKDTFFFTKRRVIWGGWAGSFLEIITPNLSIILCLLNHVGRYKTLQSFAEIHWNESWSWKWCSRVCSQSCGLLPMQAAFLLFQQTVEVTRGSQQTV